MINTLETYEVDVKTIANRDKTIAAKVDLTERAAKRTVSGPSKKGKDEKELDEMMDRKIDKVYERIRNDNWVIWKESIKLAEKEFNEGGIQKTIDLLPKVVYDKSDLKRTINTLMFDDAEQMPKPIIKTGPIKDSPKKKPAPVAPKATSSPTKPESPPNKPDSPPKEQNTPPQNPNASQDMLGTPPSSRGDNREERKED